MSQRQNSTSPHLKSKLLNDKTGITTAAITVMVIGLIVAVSIIGYVWYVNGQKPVTVTSVTQNNIGPNGQPTSTNVAASQCLAGTPQPVTELVSPYSTTSLTTPNWNRFYQSGSQLVQVTDNPGTLTSGTKSSASSNVYAIGAPSSGPNTQGPTWEQINQIGEDSFYPSWYGPLSSAWVASPTPTVATLFGQTVFQVVCVPQSGGVAQWAMSAIQFQAPTSANSSTTNTKAVMVYPGGASAPTAWPTTPTTWNFQLNINQNSRVDGLPYAECGTTANTVTNYQTNTQYTGCPQGPGAGGLPTVGMVAFGAFNVSGISLTTTSPFQAQKVGGTPSNTQLYLITSTGQNYLNPCNPSPSSGTSSTNPYTCQNIPLTVYETISQGSSKGSGCFGFVDMQQLQYLINSFTIPGQTTYNSGHWCQSATGSNAGTPTNFSGLTATTTINAGNPGPLVNQWYALDAITY